ACAHPPGSLLLPSFNKPLRGGSQTQHLRCLGLQQIVDSNRPGPFPQGKVPSLAHSPICSFRSELPHCAYRPRNASTIPESARSANSPPQLLCLNPTPDSPQATFPRAWSENVHPDRARGDIISFGI